MVSRVSIFTPKAFSIRSAISADYAALPLMRSERVARRTSSTFAASLTDKPSSSRIPSPMNAPGCGGETAMRFHGSAGLLEDVSLGGMTSGKISLTCRDLR
jgi:hypothetical protein